jgi:tryptophanase
VKEGDIVPGNAHFDTAEGHIEFRKARAIDCTVDLARNINAIDPFKGNVDLEKLDKVLKDTPREKTGCIIMTLTNNTAGGQPASMANLRGVRELAIKWEAPIMRHFAVELEMLS